LMMLSALRAHTKAPRKIGLLRRRALNRLRRAGGRARTVAASGWRSETPCAAAAAQWAAQPRGSPPCGLTYM
jgi:hypothetical protein